MISILAKSIPCFDLRNIIHIFVAVKEIGDGESPIFVLRNMDATLIRKEIEAAVIARGCFIVDVEVSRDNDIVLTVESEAGTVDMDDCVAVNDAFLEIFDRDKEDYSLTVTSAGLDRPFKVLKQFVKAVGSMVEVKFKGGRKIVGRLLEADGNVIALEYESAEAVEGKKKKVMVNHKDTFPMTGVNSVMPYVAFE